MLRLLLRRNPRIPPWRCFSSEAPSAGTGSSSAALNTSNPLVVPSCSPRLPSSPSTPSLPPRRRPFPLILLSASLISAAATAGALLYPSDHLDQTLERSRASVQRVVDRMGRTAAAAAALWRLLASVLSSVDQEMRSGFELRVAALLADISAASGARRAAIVGAGGGAVVDWLLESVAVGCRGGAQAEAARALAHLVADPQVAGDVLGRPHAVPYLLKFIFSFQPKNSKKQFKHSSLDGPDLCKGRSMLVTALMDIVTSNCDHGPSFQPLLPKNADMRDIAAAIEIIEEGGMHFDNHLGDDDNDDGDKGVQGIGIKVIGDATVLGLSRTTGLLNFNESEADNFKSTGYTSSILSSEETVAPKIGSLTRVAVPGLWDDLQREHVAVPFAAWALANWAFASEGNRAHIQELDRDGNAVMTALTAPERTVKWHGSLVAKALLSDHNLPLSDAVPDWSSSLLSTAFQASKVGDFLLTQVALSAFLLTIDRSDDTKAEVMEKGLDRMREIAKHTRKHKHLQEAVARVLELLYSGNMRFSLEESQKWSSVFLHWVFSTYSSDTTRAAAVNILSSVLEDYGPNLLPISQGWLAIMLTEILAASKASTARTSNTIKADKVKTQIDQSNALLAAQVANQLAVAVVKMAKQQLDPAPDLSDMSPLADFLSLEPFSALSKSLKKNGSSKIDAADSAFATLKGIKALTELCSEDAVCKDRLADFGILCLLRRYLLDDDYEKLAVMESYSASRVVETQDQDSNVSGDSSALDSTDSSHVRVPPTAHIRRHAARLLMILSVLPKVQTTVASDKMLCKWLDNCASGKISSCTDLKIQSYARATLLNIFCSGWDIDPVVHSCPDLDGVMHKSSCPRYEDMLFLINPESPHWSSGRNSSRKTSQDSVNSDDVASDVSTANCDDHTESMNADGSDGITESAVSKVDVVFVHGLRGGPFKSWRIADDKSSTTSKSGLVEKIDQEAGKQGTFWPSEWLAADIPEARLFTVKYKTNLTQWSGASLPLQEVSSVLLQKLIAAGIGNQPVVFVTHSMGGLIVKQMLYQAKMSSLNKLVNNTIGVVFYSCPHFGSKLADMPWRMGLVFRPAPSIGELRSGSPRLVELNDFIRHLHRKGILDILSFSETLVTPIVEGYGGWAFRMEIVPIESAYPGFGELVVLDSTDHINSCKPVSRADPSYAETLEFLKKLKARLK